MILPSVAAQENFYRCLGMFTDYQEKHPEKKARALALYDQMKALAQSVDPEMASTTIALVGTLVTVEWVRKMEKEAFGG